MANRQGGVPVAPNGVAAAANAPAVTGNASIEDALMALSPEEQAMVVQGIDPFGNDQGMMGGQPAAGPVPPAVPQGPNAAETIGILQGLLQAIPQDSEANQVAAGSIMTAIDALMQGAQGGGQQPAGVPGTMAPVIPQ